MINLLLTSIFIGSLTLTSYRSVPSQTDNSPWITSIGERVSIRGCAVSQDFLKSRELKYGDLLYIENIGFRFINDTMNARYKKSIDIWVATEQEEKQIGVRKAKVWVIHTPVKLNEKRN
jgi:3D (Asp-Asp-Asp) domain-containing protein